MAVEEVHVPGKVKNIDPKNPAEKKDESTSYWEGAVKATRAKREFLEEEKLMREIQQPPEPPEPPFKVTGGINMGTIDLQEQQRQAREEAKAMAAEAQKRIEQAERERDNARDALNAANIQHLQQNLGSQIEQLKAAVSSGNRRDIMSELESIEAVAGRLGFSKGSRESGNSLESTIQLKRLEQELKREERKFALEMKKDERMWQLELKKLDQAARESEARLEAERNKYAMIASLPEQLGASIAKGLIARNNGGGIAEEAPAPRQRATRQTKQKTLNIEAIENEAGQIDCPKCGTPVGIAPTTMDTACVGCHQAFHVTRIPNPDLAEEEAEESAGEMA